MAVQEATEAPRMGQLMKCFPFNSRLFFLTMQPQPSPIPGLLPKLFSGMWISESFIVVNRGQGFEDAAGVALHQWPPAHLAREQQILPAQRVQVLHLQAQQVTATCPCAQPAPSAATPTPVFPTSKHNREISAYAAICVR